VVRGDEAERVEDALGELYQLRRHEAPGTEDSWYRRQVLGFVVRLPTLATRSDRFAMPRGLAVDKLLQDLRFAARQMRRRPMFALLAVLTSGTGIGAATAIFSIVRSVVLEPLPFPAPDQLVDVHEVHPQGDEFVTSEPNFLDFRAHNRSLSDLAVWLATPVAARLGDKAVQLSAVRASASFFTVFGSTASLGRVFTEGEADAEPQPVAVLSHHLWRDAFGADRDVLGRSVRIDGVAHTIVGVMPPDWQPLTSTDLWLPQQLRIHGDRGDHMLNMVGRLANGQTPGSARADLMRVQRDLAARYPESNAEWGIDVRPLKTSFVGEETIRAGWMLLGAVGLLLILACASVSNILIARSTERQREMGIRNALGASPARVVQQVGTESLLLAAAGGALGVALAYAAIPVLQAVAPADTPRIGNVGVDITVLVFSTAIALSAGLLFGAAPVMHTVGTDVRTALLRGGRGSAGGGERMRAVLVVAQVAVAFTLLAGVGLLGTTFLRLQAEDPGLMVEETLAIPLTIPWDRFDDTGRRRVLEEIGQRIRSLPGVTAVGAVNVRPFSVAGTVNNLSVEGMTFGPGENPYVRWRAVTTSYLEAAGVTIVAGRGFREGDRGIGHGDRSVAVVTETMAREIWGSSETALGRRFAMSANSVNWMRVIGVTEDVRDIRIDLEPAPQFFFPDGGWWPWMTFVIRTDAEAAHLSPAIRDAIRQVDGDLPIPTIEPVAAARDRTMAGPRFNFVLMLVFGGVALLLALMGVYGVTHLATSRRTKEIGIRLALGASRTRAFGLILGSSAKLTVLGIALGLALAAVGANFLGSVLIRTDPLDPRILGAAGILMLATSLMAAMIPGWRVMRVDAASVLRAD
jgi:predicted permease